MICTIDYAPPGYSLLIHSPYVRFVGCLAERGEMQGGQVFSAMGNHEAEFLAHPAEKKAADFAAELNQRGLKPSDVAAARGNVGAFLCSEPFAEP